MSHTTKNVKKLVSWNWQITKMVAVFCAAGLPIANEDIYYRQNINKKVGDQLKCYLQLYSSRQEGAECTEAPRPATWTILQFLQLLGPYFTTPTNAQEADFANQQKSFFLLHFSDHVSHTGWEAEQLAVIPHLSTELINETTLLGLSSLCHRLQHKK